MPNIIVMFGLFILSTLYCLYYKHIDVKISDQPPRNIFQAFVFGKPSVIAFFAVLVFTNFLIGSPSRLINSMAIFYRIGSVIIGGGHVILPMMWTEFSRFGYFDEPSYWNGFSLVSCLPGPMFNMAAYIGTLINGFIGAIFCCFGLYLPSFLTIWAVLPYWNFYRSNLKIQQIIYGLCCASIGFILAAVGMLWIAACLNTQSVLDTLINTAIAAAAYYFLEWRKIPIPYVIFGGGFKFILKSLLFGNTKIWWSICFIPSAYGFHPLHQLILLFDCRIVVLRVVALVLLLDVDILIDQSLEGVQSMVRWHIINNLVIDVLDESPTWLTILAHSAYYAPFVLACVIHHHRSRNKGFVFLDGRQFVLIGEWFDRLCVFPWEVSPLLLIRV